MHASMEIMHHRPLKRRGFKALITHILASYGMVTLVEFDGALSTPVASKLFTT